MLLTLRSGRIFWQKLNDGKQMDETNRKTINVCGRIILKCILNEYNMRMGVIFN
jgi:hypothetical protein